MRYPASKKINTITIVPNLDKEEVPALTLEVVKWLGEHNIKSIVGEEDALKLGRNELAADEATIQASDLVVCLGGDGTILRAVRVLHGAPVPVLGVNLGRVGFLSEVERHEMYPALNQVIAGDFVIEERMMLKCRVEAGDFSREYLALNEVAIERGQHQRMLDLDVFINDELFSRYKADGLIFSTPTGSTAYSFSVGGPVVSPETELILLAPINAHSLFGRTVVLGAEDQLQLRLGKRVEVVIGVDGHAVFSTYIDSVTTEKAEQKVLLARLKERSFYTLFKDKLHVWDTWLR